LKEKKDKIGGKDLAAEEKRLGDLKEKRRIKSHLTFLTRHFSLA
jgi:hypothetical protein